MPIQSNTFSINLLSKFHLEIWKKKIICNLLNENVNYYFDKYLQYLIEILKTLIVFIKYFVRVLPN